MKRNVDLTENRIFTTPSENPDSILVSEWLADLTRIPWEFGILRFEEDIDFDIKNKTLIATGNRRDRQAWKAARRFYTEGICSRCGKSRGYPWAPASCNCYSMSMPKKFPWEF